MAEGNYWGVSDNVELDLEHLWLLGKKCAKVGLLGDDKEECMGVVLRDTTSKGCEFK